MHSLVTRLKTYGSISEADLTALSAPTLFYSDVYDRGAVLVEVGAPLANVFVISRGWAIRYRTLDDGRRQIVNVMLPGDCFDLQALAARHSDHTVESVTPLTIWRARTDDFLKLIHERGKLAAAFWWTAIQEDSVLREQIVRVGRRSGRERLAHLFLEFQRRLHSAGAPLSNDIPMPLTREMLADMLGLSRVHVTRSMGALRRMGLIRSVNGTVHLIKPRKLAELAQFDPHYLHLTENAA